MEVMGKLLSQFNQSYRSSISYVYNADRLFYASLGITPIFLIKVPSKVRIVNILDIKRKPKKVSIHFPNFFFYVNGGGVSVFAVDSFRYNLDMKLYPLTICNVNKEGRLCLGNIKYPEPSPNIGEYAKLLDSAFFCNQFSTDQGGSFEGKSFHSLAMNAYKKKETLDLHKFFKKMTQPITFQSLCSIR
jgi:hypothetical protein